MHTSGMPMPAFCASRCTVDTSQTSASDRGCSMICAPVDHLAIVFDMSSEMKEPVKPTTAENTSRPV
jgi:hypothetical protein